MNEGELALETPRYSPIDDPIWVKMYEDKPHSYMLHVYKHDQHIDTRFGGTNRFTAWVRAKFALRYHRRAQVKTEWIIT